MKIGALLHNAREGTLHPVWLGPSPSMDGLTDSSGRVRYEIADYDRHGFDVHADAFRSVYEARSPGKRTFIVHTFRWDGETPPSIIAWFDLGGERLHFTVECSEGIYSEPPTDDWKRNIALFPYERKLRLEMEAAVDQQGPFEDETARHVAMLQYALVHGKMSARRAARQVGLNLDDLANVCISHGHQRPYEL